MLLWVACERRQALFRRFTTGEEELGGAGVLGASSSWSSLTTCHALNAEPLLSTSTKH